MTESNRRQHIVLCEGFDDRSFWSGWLQHLGCTDPSNRGKKRVKDAWGRPVTGGRYLFHTPAGSGIIVQPFHGRGNVGQAAEEYLKGPNFPDRLVLNLDSDADNGNDARARDTITRIVETHGGTQSAEIDGSSQVEGVQLFSVIWECDETDSLSGVPTQQTLERLVCASIRAAYPDRGSVVDDWLAAEPRAESTSPKNHSYSYLAKWYAEHGADDFFRAVWRDDAVAQQLRERLERTGAWSTVESLVAD